MSIEPGSDLDYLQSLLATEIKRQTLKSARDQITAELQLWESNQCFTSVGTKLIPLGQAASAGGFGQGLGLVQ